MKKKIVLHIGSPKTGTTSFQNWLINNKIFLEKCNIDFYSDGYISPANHYELALCSYKNNIIETPISLLFKDLINNKSFSSKIKNKISNFIKKSKKKTIIFSCEELFFLSSKKEFYKLKAFLGKNFDYEIICTLRKKKEFYHSWEKEMKRFNLNINNNKKFTTNFIDYKKKKKLLVSVFKKVKIFNYSPYINSNLLSYLTNKKKTFKMARLNKNLKTKNISQIIFQHSVFLLFNLRFFNVFVYRLLHYLNKFRIIRWY
jgi:hypothetical protein